MEDDILQTAETDEELSVPSKLTEAHPDLDVETVLQAQQGDKDAFTQLFMATYQQMYYTVRPFLEQDADIYDAMQRGYTRAYRYLSGLKSPELFFAWLKTIMENAARDVYRDIKEFRSTIEPGKESQSVLPEVERRLDIRRVLSEMDPRRAQVLVLHFYDDMSFAEIARMLNEPSSTVRNRFRAAKRELLDLLRQHGIDGKLYGGTPTTMIIKSLHTAIGTNILSAATAQQMLDEIYGVRQHKVYGAAARIMEQQRNRAVQRAVAYLMLLTVGVTVITVLAMFQFHRRGTELSPAPTDTSDSYLQSGDTSGTGTSADNGNSDIPLQAEDSADTVHTDESAQTGTGSVQAPPQSAADSRDSSQNQTSSQASSQGDGFVPDYRPGKANTVGNHVNNLSGSMGTFAKQDTWLYFGAGNGNRFLYKSKTDGSEKQLLYEEATQIRYLNVLGDWIYYCSNGIYRIRTDGSNRESVLSVNAQHLHVIGSTAYFDQEGTIYRLDLQSSKLTELYTASSDVRSLGVQGDYLFFTVGKEMHIMRLSTGNVQTTLDIGTVYFAVSGSTLYFCNNNRLFSVDYTVAQPEIHNIIELTGTYMTLSFYSPYGGEFIGYSTLEHTLSVKNLSTGAVNVWQTEATVLNFFFLDDEYIYILTSENRCARVNLDGTGLIYLS